jgi:hypothetical protein
MLHYTGFITIPVHETIRFWVAADDGGTVKIGTEEFGDWNDKGCSAIEAEFQIEAGPQALDAWFYENGGGTCFMLAWQIDNGEWEIVPESAFTRGAVPVATTTTSTTSTTTTEVPTTTTSSTLPEPSTTIKPPTGTTTKPIGGNEETSTTLLVSRTDPATTLETTTTTVLATTVPETTTTTVPTTTTTDAPVKPSNVTSTTIAPTTTTTVLTTTTTTTIEQNVPTTTVVETPAQAVADILKTDEPTAQEVDAIVEQIDLLTPAQIEQVVQVLNKATNKVKKHFEQTVNVYSGKFDSYIPANQTIPVEERRTLIAITGSLVSLGATAQNRKIRR